MNFSKLVLMVAVASLTTACGFTSGYEVTGKAEGAADGDSVFLIDGNSRQIIDTALVSGGVFSFSGDCDTAKFAVVRVDKLADGSSLACPVYLEKGAISVFVAAKVSENTVSGTKSNDADTELRKRVNRIVFVIDSLDQMAKDTTLALDVRKACEQKEDSVYDNAYVTAFTSSAEKNIGLLVGIHHLDRIAYAVALPQLEALVGKVPNEYHNDAAYVKLADRVERMKSVDIGKPYVDFAMPSIEGDTLRLSSLMDGHKVVLIDFWASWCGPCRREMPNMVKAYEMFKDKGLEIVGVSQDTDGDAWRGAVKDLGMTWPQLSPLRGWDNEAIKIYAINSIPNTVIVKDGIIVAHQLTGDELISKLSELLGQ